MSITSGGNVLVTCDGHCTIDNGCHKLNDVSLTNNDGRRTFEDGHLAFE